jgi:hypothetical protein
MKQIINASFPFQTYCASIDPEFEFNPRQTVEFKLASLNWVAAQAELQALEKEPKLDNDSFLAEFGGLVNLQAALAAQQGAVVNLAYASLKPLPNIMKLQDGVCTVTSSRRRKGVRAVNETRSRLAAEERMVRLIAAERGERLDRTPLDWEDEFSTAELELLMKGTERVGPYIIDPETWFLLDETLRDLPPRLRFISCCA